MPIKTTIASENGGNFESNSWNKVSLNFKSELTKRVLSVVKYLLEY